MKVETLPVTSKYCETLNFPIDQVWKIIRDFGSWSEWWPQMRNTEITGDGRDVLHAVRRFELGTPQQPQLWQEKLMERSDETHTLSYAYVSCDVPALSAVIADILTTITLKSLCNNAKTELTWSATSKLTAAVPDFDVRQAAGYKDGVRRLVIHLSKLQLVQSNMVLIENATKTTLKSLVQADVGSFLTHKWKYDDYPQELLGGHYPLPRMVAGLPRSEALAPAKVMALIKRVFQLVEFAVKGSLDAGSHDLLGTMFDQTEGFAHAADFGDFAHFIDKLYAANSKTIGAELKPSLVEHLLKAWSDDAEFCRQFLQGPNPLQICVVKELAKVPVLMQKLSACGKSVTELMQAGRLLMADYRVLRKFRTDANPYMYFYGPVVLLCTADDGSLKVLGIELEDGKTVYTPDMPHQNRYKLAKMFVGVADTQMHEFGYHLGVAHLGIEPLIVACHNSLPVDHPLSVLLKPHFHGTIGINFLARNSLVAANKPLTNNTFAIGTTQGLQLASYVWQDYDFFGFSFPEQLKARGFDEVKTDGVRDYFYREDGFKLWNAIGMYTLDVVRRFYADDKAVEADTDLIKWTREASGEARVTGFPSRIATREMLAHVLQIIIWNASALHSVLNNAQWPLMGFSLNHPNGLHTKMPEENGQDITEEHLKEAYPTKFENFFQLSFAWFLSMTSENTLANLSAMNKLYADGAQRFKIALDELRDKILKRNAEVKSVGGQGYDYFLPETIACSVDI